MTGRVLTPWVMGDPGTKWATGQTTRPQLLVDHPLPLGASCSDVTGQPAANLPVSPNLHAVEVSGVNQAWLDAVDADPAYAVLWSDSRAKGQTIALAEHAKLGTILQTAVANATLVTAAVGAAPGGRSRAVVAEALRLWLKTRPKG